MNKASPVELRQSLEMANELASAGIRFVPVPVNDDAEFNRIVNEISISKKFASWLLEAKCAALAAENAGLKSEAQLGVIENGRAFADRLENHQFECEGGNLNMCSDWQEFRRCFEHLSEWAMHSQTEHPATDAFLAEVRAQGVEMYADNLDNVADDAERGGFDYAVKFLRSEASSVRLFASKLRKGGEQK